MAERNEVFKDPVDVRDYSLDWSEVLATGETISTSSWSADTGITVGSNSKTTTGTTVWLSGGCPDMQYKVYNTIITSASRTFKRYILVTVQHLQA